MLAGIDDVVFITTDDVTVCALAEDTAVTALTRVPAPKMFNTKWSPKCQVSLRIMCIENNQQCQ